MEAEFSSTPSEASHPSPEERPGTGTSFRNAKSGSPTRNKRLKTTHSENDFASPENREDTKMSDAHMFDMQSSSRPLQSQAGDRPTTPTKQVLSNPSEISPPASIHTATAPSDQVPNTAETPSAHGLSEGAVLNQNGKRVYNPGSVIIETGGPSRAVGAPFDSATTQVHQPSGYQWDKEEDAPGYSWRNKKAQEDYNRSWDQIVDKDKMIRRRYGDIVLRSTDKGV